MKTTPMHIMPHTEILSGTAEKPTVLSNLNLLVIQEPSSSAKPFIKGTAVHAGNLSAAIEIIFNESFDAIICDAEINRKDIADFTRLLNNNKIAEKTALLLLTLQEKTDNNALLKGLKGFDDVITSNITLADLEEKVSILKKYKLLKTRLPYKPDAAQSSQYEHKNFSYISKRALDILFSSFLLLLVSPLIIIISIAIKLESKGPVFYLSKRAGRWYKVFTFYKFRTMVVNADSMIPNLQYMNEYKDQQTSFFFKLKEDPRVTRVGRFLRRTSLDELPQLINVLKGDMSIVGNRPLPLYEAQTITVDKSAKRFFATAGITGLWQIKGRSNLNLTIEERIAMDVAYADKSSFLYDLKIMLKTPKKLIHKNNV